MHLDADAPGSREPVVARFHDRLAVQRYDALLTDGRHPEHVPSVRVHRRGIAVLGDESGVHRMERAGVGVGVGLLPENVRLVAGLPGVPAEPDAAVRGPGDRGR